MNRLAVVLALAVSLSLVGASAQAGDLVVVVNRANPARALTRDELAVVFTMARSRWSDGSVIVPLSYAPDDGTRNTFDRVVLGMDPAKVGRFWLDQRIRGITRTPRQLGQPAVAVRLVARVKGAIAYVPAGTDTAAVKVVARVRDGRVLPP